MCNNITGECAYKHCSHEIKVGDKVYQESYYGSVFCSIECLVSWSNKEYDWSTANVEDIYANGHIDLREGSYQSLHEDNKVIYKGGF